MPITLPNLDDRTYASLVDEAIRLIPTLAPSWTDFNPSDPGITLVELLAYLTEMLLYRLDRVTDANRLAFLRLLNGPDWKLVPSDRPIGDAIRSTILALRAPVRAVTADDYVGFALKADARVARAFCVPNRNLEVEPPSGPPVNRPGQVGVVIIPKADASGVVAEVIKAVADDLELRRLLTTRVNVVGPRLVTVGVRVTLVLRADALREFPDLRGGDVTDLVRKQAVKALQSFFDPLSRGLAKGGWPFGRDVFVSEVYQVLGDLPGVDHVTATIGPDSVPLDELTVGDADAGRLFRVVAAASTSGPPRQGVLYAVSLQPHELVNAQIDPAAITVPNPPTGTGS